MKVWHTVRRVKQGGYGSRTGRAAPPPPPPDLPWCRGATEGPSPQGQASTPFAFPWPRLGVQEPPLGGGAALGLCEASSSSSSHWGDGGGGAHLPS